MKQNETIRKTLEFYKDKDQSIHISLLSGIWLNGKIVSIGKDSFVLEEEKAGEMLIRFERIKDDGISPRLAKVEKDNKWGDLEYRG